MKRKTGRRSRAEQKCQVPQEYTQSSWTNQRTQLHRGKLPGQEQEQKDGEGQDQEQESQLGRTRQGQELLGARPIGTFSATNKTDRGGSQGV